MISFHSSQTLAFLLRHYITLSLRVAPPSMNLFTSDLWVISLFSTSFGTVPVSVNAGDDGVPNVQYTRLVRCIRCSCANGEHGVASGEWLRFPGKTDHHRLRKKNAAGDQQSCWRGWCWRFWHSLGTLFCSIEMLVYWRIERGINGSTLQPHYTLQLSFNFCVSTKILSPGARNHFSRGIKVKLSGFIM